MNNEQLSIFFRILKKNGIPKGVAAKNLAISAGYISKLISGDMPITKQIIASIKDTYPEYLSENFSMNKILSRNLYQARLRLGNTLKETITLFGYHDLQEMYACERGEIEPPDNVIRNVIDLLVEAGYIKDGLPDIETDYIAEEDNIFFKKSSTPKQTANVVGIGDRTKLI